MFYWASGYVTSQMTAVIDTEVILPETDNDGERHKEHSLRFKVRWDGVNVGETAEVSVGVGGWGWSQMLAGHEKEWQVRQIGAGKQRKNTWSSGTRQRETGDKKNKETRNIRGKSAWDTTWKRSRRRKGWRYGTDPRQHMNSGSSNMSREEANGEPALRRHMASS